jgi:hypothetical protein
MHLLAQPLNTRQQRSTAVQLQQQHLPLPPLLPLLLWLQWAWSGSWMRSWTTMQQTNSSSSSSSKCMNSSKRL